MIRRPPRSTLLSLHDALPILAGWLFDNPISLFYRRHLVSAWVIILFGTAFAFAPRYYFSKELIPQLGDRKSTRLNSSHANISYAVFCLKKKKHYILILFKLIH